MASSDEEELAALRAARRQAMGGLNGSERGGVDGGRGAARRWGGRGDEDDEDGDDDGGNGASAAPSAVDDVDKPRRQEEKKKQPSFRPPPLVLPPSDDDDDEEKEDVDVDMAAAGLPMSFGGGGGGKSASLPAAAAAAAAPTKKRQRDDDDDDDDRRREKEKPSSDDDDSEEDTGDSDDEDDLNLPITRAAAFEACERSVTCLAIDRSGTRLAAGSRDGRVRLFDFGGARDDLRAFRSFFPLLSGSLTSGGGGGGDDDDGVGGDGEGAGATPPVVSLCWLPGSEAASAAAAGGGGGGGSTGGGGGGGGALLLVACSDARLVLCDREGRKLAESARGDSYLADPKNTRGHTAPVTCCCCLFNNASSSSSAASASALSLVDVASGSEDGTVRIWGVVYNENNERSPWSLKQKVVIKVPVAVGGGGGGGGGGGNKRAKVTALAFLAATATKSSSSSSSSSSSPSSNNLLVAGTEDGAIHCWDPRARKGRPAAAGAAVTGPTARLLGLSAKTQDWSFVAGHAASTSRSVAGAHGGEFTRSTNSKAPSFKSNQRDSYVSPAITCLAPPPPHLDDGARVASRGEDGTVKLWDFSERTRAQKTPLVWSSSSDSSESPPPLFLPAEEPTTGLAWSPDGRYLATGTSEGKLAVLLSASLAGEKGGKRRLVRCVDVVDKITKKAETTATTTTATTTTIAAAPSSSSASVVPVSWHPRLNQIFVGVSDPSAAAAAAAAAKQRKRTSGGIGGGSSSSSIAGGGVIIGGSGGGGSVGGGASTSGAAAAAAGGRVVALYSPRVSERGVLLALARKSKRPRGDGAVAGAGTSRRVLPQEGDIFNPHALPLYRSERKPGVPLAAVGGGSKRKPPPAAVDSSTSAAPLPGRGGAGPALGAGSGGRVGASGGTLLTQHVLKSRGGFGLVAPRDEGDIRERMLAHGDLSKEDPEMAALTAAYKKTQPAPVFLGGGGKGKGKDDDGDDGDDGDGDGGD